MKLYLISGLPGAGKSTRAKALVEAGDAQCHFEADQWMVGPSGEYEFSPQKLAGCHKACQDAARQALSEGRSVVVSNTFLRQWEVDPYLEIASEAKAEVVFERLSTNFGSVHGVPEEKVAWMRGRMEEVSIEA